jgi:hypothetical protein
MTLRDYIEIVIISFCTGVMMGYLLGLIMLGLF